MKNGAFRQMSDEDSAFSWRRVPGVILGFLDKDKPKFIFFNIVLFLIFFYELVPAFVVGKVIDFFAAYHIGDSLQTFYYYVVFLAISYIVVAIIRLRSKNVLSKIAIDSKSRARTKGFERLMDASIEWHNKENTGNKVQRIMTGGQSIFELIKMASGIVYPVVVTFVGVSLYFLFTNWLFFIFIIIYGAVFLAIMLNFNKKLESLSLEQDQAIEKSSGAYIEGAGNILSIKAVGAEKKINSQIRANERVIRDFQFALTDTNNKKWRFFQIWNGLAYGVILFLIGHQVLAGAVSVGMILVLFNYFNRLQGSANDVNDISTVMVGFKVDLGRMMPIFENKSAIRSGNKSFPKDWDSISIGKGGFDYENKKAGIIGFDLDIRRGSRIGIAGVSGSGKSTLVKILLGLYELKGGRFQIGQTDFYDISREEITENISVVLQETELFNLSFQENITMMRDFDAALFEKAIEIADLREVIARLPDGLATEIGERGYSLSGGERQRIGIARAIYKNSQVLVLDEATSSLDSKTEKNIVDRLFGEFGRDKTFVIVAHRLSTIRNADEIIVMKNGRISERGSFKELIKKEDSQLSELYRLQR